MDAYLVIQLARFGDIVQTGRLIASLLQDGEVHLCVDESLVDIASIIYPECNVFGVSAHNGSFREQLTYNVYCFTELKQYKYAQVFNLNYSGMNFSLARLFPPEIVRGYLVKDGQAFRDMWMRMAFRWTEDRKLSPLNLVDFWGLLAPNPVPPQSVNPSAKPGGKGLGVVLAGRNSRRSLPPEYLATVINVLFESVAGDAIYLLGSKGERGLGRQLLSLMPSKLVDKTENKAGQTGWRELVELVSDLDLVLTPDTGTMHLAAKLGSPVCAMFLSSAWAWETGPYGLGHQVWQASMPCAPCAEAAPCPRNVACLEAYKSSDFFKRLTGSSLERQANLLRLQSSFDELGLIWESDEEDRVEEARKAQRSLLKEYQGLKVEDCKISRDAFMLADNLYLEADWMLPNAAVRI